ncbi:MAG: hypothetical protein K8T90_07495 [Planctomycetes bacterium]|nr:hypothetical protein [Planctomycetota bacterium]
MCQRDGDEPLHPGTLLAARENAEHRTEERHEVLPKIALTHRTASARDDRVDRVQGILRARRGRDGHRRGSVGRISPSSMGGWPPADNDVSNPFEQRRQLGSRKRVTDMLPEVRIDEPESRGLEALSGLC